MQPNSRVYFALAAHIKTHITALSQRHVTQSPSVSQLCSAEISCAARLHKETKMRRQGGEGEARVCSAKPDALVTFLNTTSLLGEPKLKRAANTNMYEQANACCEFTLKKILQTLSLNLTASASHYDLWHTKKWFNNWNIKMRSSDCAGNPHSSAFLSISWWCKQMFSISAYFCSHCYFKVLETVIYFIWTAVQRQVKKKIHRFIHEETSKLKVCSGAIQET